MKSSIMVATLKYRIVSLSIILMTWAFSSLAQTPIEYQGHKILTSPSTEEYYFEQLRANRSLESDKLISQFDARGNNPTVFNLSLNDSPELYFMDNPFEYGSLYFQVFRSHNLETLETEFSAEIFHRGSGSSFNYSEGQIAFQIGMWDTTGVAVSNWGITYYHNSNTFERNIRVLVDIDLNEIYRRDILFKTNGLLPIMLTGELDNNQGLVNTNYQINDFSFRDSLYIIQNEDTVFRYSDDWVVSLEVSSATNVVWSGDLEYSGTLKLMRSILFGLESFRVFTISGEVDFDPMGQTFAYETPSGETHLVLVKYSETGNVEWTKTMARFEEWVENPGSFHVDLNKDGDERIQLYFDYRGSLASDSVGVLSAMVDDNVIVSGVLTPIQISRHSPDYIYVLDAETGEVIKAYDVYNDASNGEYTTRKSTYITTQKEGEVSFSLRNFIGFSTPFVVQKLYPEFLEFPLVNNPPEGYEAYQFVTLSTTDETDDFEHFNIYYTSYPGRVDLRYIPLVGENMMFAGDIITSSDVYVGSTLLNLENNPDPNFGQDGLIIFAEESSVSTNELDSNALQVRVYPNPTSDYIEVDAQSDFPVEYSLFNSLGTVVLQGKLSGSNKIDLRAVGRGLYFLQVSHGESSKRSTVKIEKL